MKRHISADTHRGSIMHTSLPHMWVCVCEQLIWTNMNSREQMHCICMLPDMLLSVFGKVLQHFEWNHTNGNVILVRPDLHSDQHHTCVQVFFKDLPSDRQKDRRKLVYCFLTSCLPINKMKSPVIPFIVTYINKYVNDLRYTWYKINVF